MLKIGLNALYLIVGFALDRARSNAHWIVIAVLGVMLGLAGHGNP